MYIPSHLKHFSSCEFRNDYITEIKREFEGALNNLNLTFDNFEQKLNKLEKALFFKAGFLFCHYIKDLQCNKCSHQTIQLRFLSCMAVIESLLGNAEQKKVWVASKKIKEPLVVTFLTNNLSPSEKGKLSENINIRKNGRSVKSLFFKLKSLVDMRNGFMHRGELVRIGNDIGGYISKRRSHRGRDEGIISITIGLKKLTELLKISIIRYLLAPRNTRKPLMRHNIIR